ncbi:MAG: hypothetical protein QMD06_05160 [Candidatus Altarchaeum sp.]|nr:hypothetical protein [Candidatus Altarchaeum sp.]
MDKKINKYNDNEDDEDEESAKFKTIVARQAVRILRVSHNNINEFVLKMQKGQILLRKMLTKHRTIRLLLFICQCFFQMIQI